MKQRYIIIAIAAIALVGIAAALWTVFASPTRIAFVNYQTITLGQIARANDNSFVKISELPVEELSSAGRYDMVFVNGMGLRITEEQREALENAAQSGTPVITTAVTNPQNLIVSVDSVATETLKAYLAGGKSNYRNLLRYVRKNIDGKKLFVDNPGEPVVPTSSLMYYPQASGDELAFASVAEYEFWLRSQGKWRENAPRIILTGQMGVPDSLIAALERTGNMVYPVNVIQKFITGGHADSVAPAAVINMPHGRMGDMVSEYLEHRNIPLFAPVNVNRPYDEWMADKMSMSGGFLSQSIVTPEIDGAIRPFSLFAHFEGSDGLQYADAIPGRLNEFVTTVNNYMGLRTNPRADKKISIFYFKGPGQSALVAEGMEVAPSLFNLLTRLKAEGYNVDGLPASAAELEKMINERGKVFNPYALGAKADFVAETHPQMISAGEYNEWCDRALSPGMRDAIDAVDGAFPGHGLSDADGNLAVARLQFGNIVLIPQTAAGLGDDDFKTVHGTDAAPPHGYVAAYLWARYGFGADALMHFGAHGSLEFTPRKQVALGSDDWSDRLIGTLPHIYIYSTSNVGEAMIAKRRAYAGIISYLTPPFMESNVRGIYKNLTDAIAAYNNATTRADSLRCARLVRMSTLELGIHRELRIDSTSAFNAADIARIESFAEELANERITGALYVMGQPYSSQHIGSTVEAMTVDPLAYALRRLDGERKDISAYRSKALILIRSAKPADDKTLCAITGLPQVQIDSARTIKKAIDGSHDMLSRMMVMGSMMPAAPSPAASTSKKKQHRMIPGMSADKAMALARKMGASDEALKRMEAAMKHKSAGAASKKSAAMPPAREFSKEQTEFAIAASEVERCISNVENYRHALAASPQAELASVVNALDGGFIAPTSGGDPVLNPDILPTGRNMYAVNAEETPSALAWDKGKSLADNTIEMYRRAHGDSIPRKVSYTLWSSEFIETEGATIAQVLYVLGVEPVRDPFGRVTDLRLIPSAELGRPRIDVVVQTSGQLRDLAASRLFLISRAVKMAAAAEGDIYPNYVAEGVVESERHLVSSGVSPKEARSLSTARVFGGVDGNYGSGIQGLVEAGDRWESEDEIAGTYIANMGAMYGSEEEWEALREHAFEAALTRTDVVVQPRQSNTWGALSLDHVYEFMGGMNLAVRNVTGKDPDAYLSDYRNSSNARMQEVKEAIGVESRTTILNPSYIKEKMKGGSGDAAGIADVVRNTYGWNVMKPDVIDNELWDDIYDTYIADRHGLGTVDYFKNINPAAIQEITAVMLETARKGMWQASPEKLGALAELHTQVIEESGAACTGFVCDNAALRSFIADKVDASTAGSYKAAVAQVRAEKIATGEDAMVMKREDLDSAPASAVTTVNGIAVAVAVVAVLALFIFIIRRQYCPLKMDVVKN